MIHQGLWKKNGELEKKYTQIFCNDWIMNLGKKLGSCLVCLRTSRPLLWFYFLLRKCPKLQIEIGGRGRHTLFTTFLLNVEKLELGKYFTYFGSELITLCIIWILHFVQRHMWVQRMGRKKQIKVQIWKKICMHKISPWNIYQQ